MSLSSLIQNIFKGKVTYLLVLASPSLCSSSVWQLKLLWEP